MFQIFFGWPPIKSTAFVLLENISVIAALIFAFLKEYLIFTLGTFFPKDYLGNQYIRLI